MLISTYHLFITLKLLLNFLPFPSLTQFPSFIMLRFGLLVFFSFLLKAEAQSFTCDPANNTLGTCECNQQLFIAEDCTKVNFRSFHFTSIQCFCKQGFFCFNGTTEETGPYEGCHIICTEGLQLLVDPRNGGSWKCVPFNDTISCPGKFNTGNIQYCRCLSNLFTIECECNGDAETCPIGDCECDGQLRVSEDCKTAKYVRLGIWIFLI